MAEGSYIPLTNEALEDFKEYLKIPWLMQNIVPDPPGTKFRSIRSKRYRTAARLFLLCSTIPPRIRLPEFDSITETDLFSPAGNENLNKEDFEEGVLYRYTIKLVQSSGK